MSEPVRVVYDCMIFLQAAARPSRVHGTMGAIADGRVSLCVSPAIIEEVRDVLNRPELRAKFPALTPGHVDAFLNDQLARATLFFNVPPVFSLPRDPKDEPYVDLAIAANARFLVTWNRKHLAYLMEGDTQEGAAFCQQFPEIRIVDPPTFLAELPAVK
ncbi:MAG TPA: putative toxin-antitoxin system toxin component, PIN family [Humisphaera sp.]|jgi:putative PIN family toxin of toxin-antitoxin system|nr:putative toxin-antitoxin system toxin component, PIN family [Humisphaera sp.]